MRAEGSFNALGWALDYVVSGAEVDRSGEDPVELLTLVHVQQPFQHYVFPAGPGGTAFYATSTVIGEEGTRRKRCPYPVSCTADAQGEETLVLSGDTEDMICQATEQMHTDLLVVGSRGLGKFKRAFLGSVNDYCAHHENKVSHPNSEASQRNNLNSSSSCWPLMGLCATEQENEDE